MMVGSKNWRAARRRMRIINANPRVPTETIYGKSHGVPSSNWFWTAMNHAKIPKQVVDPERTTNSHIFSCT